MAQEFSFDIVSVLNMQEVDNAVNQTMKEILQRFDFRGSKSQITLDKDKKIVTLISDDESKLKSVVDILQTKLVKRGISLKALVYGKVEPALGSMVRQVVTLQQGISQEKAKDITKLIRDTGLKLRTQIQGDEIRVFSKSKDDLQTTIGMLREKDFGVPLQFANYR
ncbi:YajQ family cyclic di-GMP-binding protein [Candidatus Desantisbacteria bacterium CG1_02_38_46]|uniref:Nucleotide-binding protein COY51_07050 n=3 Tax=unclassified Candidatus Desantisiibacteriota TaxID=3106372 RepID=A0A2H9PAS2_9BACT|nr:MAG: YajQ family cyclic di-GMP-binding protein [Candidatus Desantisbacteria bacterium CG1_02_38_46]PIU51922.1 MAG: YajQ family cyclic di-GMP-binding protein [Candidatus Desantisbacteria bacterium CG07_land_8_20_14_0_80_39_15]PIZ14873.1 MAG: YajQ family cyclic di-GMP-binding protein [Candidatus Desantisbacteria bacterium CG_4_10_14_0_8_um_filter_39_17]